MIEGHTDSTGSEQYNQRLSENRAKAVRDALMMKGLNSARIQTVGYGEQYPATGNETTEGRQRNRRVEVVISDEKGNIPQRTSALSNS
jgi:outer membrane protein OmpA-like peptidoglycan-associated protein